MGKQGLMSWIWDTTLHISQWINRVMQKGGKVGDLGMGRRGNIVYVILEISEARNM